jgi:hypothetical protein
MIQFAVGLPIAVRHISTWEMKAAVKFLQEVYLQNYDSIMGLRMARNIVWDTVIGEIGFSRNIQCF